MLNIYYVNEIHSKFLGSWYGSGGEVLHQTPRYLVQFLSRLHFYFCFTHWCREWSIYNFVNNLSCWKEHQIFMKVKLCFVLLIVTCIWVSFLTGIGAGVDSFFEYLVKGSILFGRPELRAMFEVARLPIEKYLNKNHWYVWASMTKGQVTLPVFQSLEAYWPGVLALIGIFFLLLHEHFNFFNILLLLTR